VKKVETNFILVNVVVKYPVEHRFIDLTEFEGLILVLA
jgi:hypothetical protein